MKFIATLYAIMDKRPLRALSLLMALLLAGCIFWDPSRFAGEDQRAGNLAWFLADVGGLQRRYSRRGLSPACRSLAGDFLSAYR